MVSAALPTIMSLVSDLCAVNWMGEESRKGIAAALEKNSTLTQVDLSGECDSVIAADDDVLGV